MEYHGKVENKEAHARKYFSRENSCLLDRSITRQRASEVLRKAKGSITSQPVWSGRGVWFGIIENYAEMMLRV